MANSTTTESDIEKVLRIAKVLDISIEEAAVTCDAFHLAFSDDGMRRAIFDIVDELDRSAARKGEPLGLIINYTVELGLEGIRVGRYADEIPAGEVVELTPPHRANILLRINDNFPTQEFLGPLIVNRPEPLAEEQYPWERDDLASDVMLPSLAKEGWQTDVFCRADGVVHSDKARSSVETPPGQAGLTDADTTQSEIPTELPSHWPRIAIPLGPVRLTLNDRFQFLSADDPVSQLDGSTSLLTSLSQTSFARPLLASAASHPGQPTSGLSPPPGVGNRGHSASKDVPGPWQ